MLCWAEARVALEINVPAGLECIAEIFGYATLNSPGCRESPQLA
jgi:hypothetical protein